MESGIRFQPHVVAHKCKTLLIAPMMFLDDILSDGVVEQYKLFARNGCSPCLTGKRKSLMVTDIHPQVHRGAAKVVNPKS